MPFYRGLRVEMADSKAFRSSDTTDGGVDKVLCACLFGGVD